MTIDLPAIPAGILTLLSLLAPYAVAVINRPAWSPTVRKIVSILVPIVLAAVVLGFYYAATGDVVPAWPALVLLAIVVVQASYALLTKTSATVLEQRTSPGPGSTI